MKLIRSVNNYTVKNIVGLIQKSLIRRKSDVFVVEGKRELQLAEKSGFKIDKIFCCSEIFKNPKIEEWYTQNLGINNMVRVTENVYRKISYRKNTEGIVALVKKKKMDLDSIAFKNKKPLVLVAENIEKPGNIGALLLSLIHI